MGLIGFLPLDVQITLKGGLDDYYTSIQNPTEADYLEYQNKTLATIKLAREKGDFLRQINQKINSSTINLTPRDKIMIVLNCR